jgi:membrane protein required for colicin V production
LNILDIILSALLLYGLIRGFIKGLFVEITSLAALALGLYGAIHFSFLIATFFSDKFDWPEKYIQISAFATTFVIIVILITLLGKLLTKIADKAALGFINKAFGAIFGLTKIGLILSVILLIVSNINKYIPFVDQQNFKSSILYKPVKNLAPLIFPSIIKENSNIPSND